MKTVPLRRFRNFVLALDLGGAGAVVVFLLGTLFSIYSFFSGQYFDARLQDADKTRLILEEHLKQAQQELRSFVELEEIERAGVSRLFLRSFSDLYQLDADLKIVRIYTSVPGNRLFPGYSFAQGRLGRYLQEDSQPDDFSEIMMGLEDEKPSLYYHIKTPEEEFLARVEISYLTTLLEKMTQFSGIPILLLARDGFVVTSTVPQLGVSTLNPQLTRSDLRHLEIGGRNWAPLFSESRTSGVTVALLIPLRVLELLRNILLFSALFSIVALAVITLLKMRLMDRLMLAPLSAFADRLEQFATGTHPPEPPVKPYRFEELALLDKRFTEMAQTLAEREEGVRNALAQLRESEERFAKAFHSNPAPMVISEINTGRFLDVNAQWLAMLGYTREETLNHTSKELGIWLDPEHRDRVIRQLKSQGHIKDVPTEFRTKFGEERITLWSAEIVTLGNREMMLSLIRDITEERRAETEREKVQVQLNQAQKMESVGRLAGGVAHDFNNMLSVILGHVDLLLDSLPPDNPLRSDLDEVRKAAVRSADLTRQLLAFARKQTVAPRVLDLNETVEGMLKMLRRLIGENIDLAWLPGQNLGTVLMDPSQIDQILANLCVNARDAIGGQGGRVTIETERVRFDEAYCETNTGFMPGEYVMLSVSDDGCGMDAETLSLVFEPFFTTKTVGEGTGLGLATVYGVVRQNGGFINVYSEPGLGTTFRIYLPWHGDETFGAPREEGEKNATVCGHETILLVEDEPAILGMTTMILEQLQYTVLATASPGAAIRLVTEYSGEIHLLMTDVIMPEMNGRDLAAKLLELRPGLKRLFMSGYTADVIAHHGVLDDGVYFIQKPFSMKDLANKVREVLEWA